MSKQYFSKETNKQICHGFGCQEKAIAKIDVSAGKYGTITLDLCDSCMKLFQKK
jgi:hypothetical protein